MHTQIRRLVRCAAALPLVLGVALPAAAQSGIGEKGLEVAPRFMLHTLRGDAHGGLGMGYDDAYGPGAGGGADVLIHFHMREGGLSGTDVSFGPYLGIDSTTFGAERVYDSIGDSLLMDDLSMTRLLFGFHARSLMGRADRPVRFLLGGQIGIGFAFMNAVDADFDLSTSGFGQVHGAAYEDTVTYAYEVSVRTGVAIRLGDRANLTAFVFAGFTGAGAPSDVGNDPQLMPFDPDPMAGTVIGLGISLDFLFPTPEGHGYGTSGRQPDAWSGHRRSSRDWGR